MNASDGYIRAISLSGHEELCAAFGCNLRLVMDEVGIPITALERPDDLISFRAFVTMIELIAKRHNITNFGIEISKNAAPSYTALGPSLLMSKFVKSVGEWQETAIRYWRFFTNGFAMQVLDSKHSSNKILRITMNALSIPAPQFTEACVGNIIGVTRVAVDDFVTNPIAVRLQHQRPSDISNHLSFFGCPVEFGCDHIEIEFENRIFDFPTKGSATLFKPLMQIYIAERIRRMHLFDHSATSTVALAISSLLGSGQCNLESVATALTSNSKALQRQLAKENIDFSELLEKVRENTARRLLVDTDAPVAHIAGLLDYSTNAPFTTAFERWTGTTPLRFRQHERIKLNLGRSLAVDN